MTTVLPQPGFVIWFTGLPASGKSSSAQALRTLLAKRGIPTLVLDSDEMRAMLVPDPSYTTAEQERVYGAMAHLAAWLAHQGHNILIAATANERRYRDALRHKVPHFIEVYVVCDMDICRERDPKGIYALADAGEASHVPGLGVPYEPPLAPELTIDTTNTFADDAAYKVFLYLRRQPFFN